MRLTFSARNFLKIVLAVFPLAVIAAILWVLVHSDMVPQETERMNPPPVSYPDSQKRQMRRKHYPLVRGVLPFSRPLLRWVANEASANTPAQPTEDPNGLQRLPQIKPHRTFITLESYLMENNGEGPENTISNVRLELLFPSASGKEEERKQVVLPAKGQWWPIENMQIMEINQTYEIPFEYINNDGFKLQIQMDRKGAWIRPCKFNIVTLSQFNRTYICKTDLKWQKKRGIPDELLDKEAIQIRVFTDIHPLPKDKGIPKGVIAIR